MTGYETIRVETDDRGVARLILNRPEKRNALSARMMHELTDFAGRVASAGIRAVVLSGAGGTFCAGGDLDWMMTQMEADRATRMAEARRLAEMLMALNEMPVPLIGRIDGAAMGGGIGMACICDVALAADGCRFGFTETRLGIIPATIAPYVIARMGEGPARRVFMSGRIFGAQEAARVGIVADHVAAHDLDDRIAAEVAPYLEVTPEAAGRAKALARSLGPRIDGAVIDVTIEQLADAWETEAARERIAAFLNRRSGGQVGKHGGDVPSSGRSS